MDTLAFDAKRFIRAALQSIAFYFRTMALYIGKVTRFIGLLLLTLFAVTSPAQAAVEAVPPTFTFVDISRFRYTTTVSSYDAAGCREAQVRQYSTGVFSPGFFDLWHYSMSVGTCYYQSTIGWAPSNFGTIQAACPAPTVNPTVPYKYNPATSMCERQQDSLIITLQGGREVEPSKDSSIKSLPFTATVKNQSDGQPPTNPVTVNISLKVDPTSGGHVHGDSTRPRGGIDGTACASDSTCRSFTTNGTVGFNFNTPEASGTHTITAMCDRCTNNPQAATVDVKVAGLLPIPPSGLYALYEADGSVIGAVGGRHPSNHYLTPAAANRLLVIAINYHHLNPQTPVLHINDASLMWGGVFDIDVEADWNTPHKEHMRGTVVDIRANSRTGAIPPASFDSFIRLAKINKVNAKIHSSGISNQHFHVRLLNRSE